MKRRRTGAGMLPREMQIITRLTSALVLGLLCMSFQATAFSRQAKITLTARQQPLNEVLKELSRQTGLNFLYSHEVVREKGNVSVEVTDKELGQVLDELLPALGLEHVYRDNSVVIRERAPGAPQERVARGKVTDDKGIAMPGVTVRLEGATLGTITDANGEFSLRVPATRGNLQFSFIGYKTRVVAFEVGKPLEIRLEEEVKEIDEVVVTGIFNRRAESFTGSAQTVTREELRKVGNTNILQSLKNIDPSFQIIENLADGSNPNVMPEIQLRGQSGFPDLRGEYQGNPNQPLFILDGFEASLTKIMDMDMNRVETVTLLKDAAAKAIYGSKAANGVVVIETRRPATGRMQVTYTGSLNIQAPDLTSYDLCNAAEKLQVEYNAGLYDYLGYNGVVYWQNASEQYNYTSQYNELLKEVARGVDTDWLSQPVRVGTGQKHVLYLEGGDEYLRYGLDFSINDVKGTMKGSARSTFAGGITLSYRLKNISLRDNLEVAYNRADNSPWGNFSEYARMNPYLRIRDENGNVLKSVYGGQSSAGGSQTVSFPNPVWNSTINTRNYSIYSQITNNFYMEWLAFTGFKLTGRVGLTLTNDGTEIFYPATHTNFYTWTTEELAPRRGQYIHGDGRAFSFATDANAQYTKGIGEHLLFANLGWNLNTDNSRSVTTTAEGFPNDHLDDIAFARSYLKDSKPSASAAVTRNIGVLGAANYSYGDRYLVDASIRFSGSSQFGSKRRWGQFWSLGAGWNLHQEKFMENAAWLTRLKLRASIGYTGSQNFNSYQSLATYSYYLSDTYDGNVGAYLLGIANDELQWQRKHDQNIGVDMILLDRRLSIRADYYVATTDDLLTAVTIPSSTGFTSYMENLGKVKNTGMEFRVTYHAWANPEQRAFVNLYAAGTRNTNKIVQISNSLASFNDEQVANATNKPVVRYEEGQSMSAIWAVPSRGIDPSSGKDVFVRKDGETTFIWNSDDMAVCGDSQARMTGNFGINADFKGFSLNVGMTYRVGGQLYNQTLVNKVENADLAYNVDRRIFSDRWVKPGDVSRFKDIADQTTTYATSRFVEDNDTWTLSSINLSYDFDRVRAIREAGFRRVRLSFDTSDVAHLSSIKIERGTSYPFARSFSFSLQAMF
ncbi:MAG: SusC/RagA family TonB-linked outer membrane protein [Odoribacteraceae bacterium]|jgi:TonB-linked SusC/RagA family outer membrane protein|nr:SusC/RagA family TonB-linked outer membrane protein [Odoribacteraceae bacterium]